MLLSHFVVIEEPPPAASLVSGAARAPRLASEFVDAV